MRSDDILVAAVMRKSQNPELHFSETFEHLQPGFMNTFTNGGEPCEIPHLLPTHFLFTTDRCETPSLKYQRTMLTQL